MMHSDGALPTGPVSLARRRPWIIGGTVVVLLTPIAWYLLSPLLIDQHAQEEPSVAAAARAGAVVSRGSFGEIDAVHKGAGQAVLTRLANGTHVLRFEGFRVTNGPDLYVYLSGHPAPRSSSQLHETGDLEVAVLKGNVGDQSYELPASFDPAAIKSVVIYCKRFTTVFSTAELKAG